jgi:hypothetical protein
MLKGTGCSVDYFPAEKCDMNSYDNAIKGAYDAVYISAHGVYRDDLGYSVILSNEYEEKGLFGQIWGGDEQSKAEIWERQTAYVMQAASDSWYNNKFCKAYPVGAIKPDDANRYTGRLFYFASCEALKTKNPNFWNGFSGTIIGWDGKNVVGEAIGEILFYKLVRRSQSVEYFKKTFKGWQDPETDAFLQIKGQSNFKFLSTDSDNPYTNVSTITHPFNGQYIKTTNKSSIFTIKGTYNVSDNLFSQPKIQVTNSKGEILMTLNVSPKNGKFSKTI